MNNNRAILKKLVFTIIVLLGASIAFTHRGLYLVAGITSVIVVGFDVNPLMREKWAQWFSDRTRISYRFCHENILPASLLLAWPFWAIVAIRNVWKDSE